MQIINIPVDKIDQLSSRDKAYLLDSQKFQNYTSYNSTYEAFEAAIKDRAEYPIDHEVLGAVLKDQYASLSSSTKTQTHLNNLAQPNSYCVVTAHQPSLLSGPLYYVYKILATIHLATRLSQDHPDITVAPVFVLGEEDHDFDEINHLHLYGKKVNWDEDYGGSVSQYPVDKLGLVIDQVIEILGANSRVKSLLEQLKNDIGDDWTYSDFSFKLTHILFDQLGLVILRMGDRRLKAAFIPKIIEELINQPSQALVQTTQQSIKEELGYEAQAFPREINFFYTSKGSRKRIVQENDRFQVLDSALQWTKEALLEEVKKNPQNFSPNVIMRPIYQESILPNLAYVGGGGELAYWMERKQQFEHFNTFYPILIRRVSAMIVSENEIKQTKKLGLQLEDLFKANPELIKYYLAQSEHPTIDLADYKRRLDGIYEEIKLQAVKLDKSLGNTVGSEVTKAKKSLDYIDSKMRKSTKQKEEVALKRIEKLKSNLFPSGLQERHNNIFQYLSQYGLEYLEKLLPHFDPFSKEFRIFVMSEEDH